MPTFDELVCAYLVSVPPSEVVLSELKEKYQRILDEMLVFRKKAFGSANEVRTHLLALLVKYSENLAIVHGDADPMKSIRIATVIFGQAPGKYCAHVYWTTGMVELYFEMVDTGNLRGAGDPPIEAAKEALAEAMASEPPSMLRDSTRASC